MMLERALNIPVSRRIIIYGFTLAGGLFIMFAGILNIALSQHPSQIKHIAVGFDLSAITYWTLVLGDYMTALGIFISLAGSLLLARIAYKKATTYLLSSLFLATVAGYFVIPQLAYFDIGYFGTLTLNPYLFAVGLSFIVFAITIYVLEVKRLGPSHSFRPGANK